MIKGVTHAHLWPIWYQTEPLEVPYSANQFLVWDFFCRFLQQTGSNIFSKSNEKSKPKLKDVHWSCFQKSKWVLKTILEPLWSSKGCAMQQFACLVSHKSQTQMAISARVQTWIHFRDEIYDIIWPCHCKSK